MLANDCLVMSHLIHFLVRPQIPSCCLYKGASSYYKFTFLFLLYFRRIIFTIIFTCILSHNIASSACSVVPVPQLRTFLTDVLIDQMPILVELQRFLTHLACTEPAPPKKQLLLELVQSLF